ncbi:MAG TPA: element excision factor XisI family protein, partial [Anaerolineae bacterium]
MAKLEEYREHVKQLIKKYGSYKPAATGVERQVIFDTENDHYLLFSTGWDDDQRVHGATIHI